MNEMLIFTIADQNNLKITKLFSNYNIKQIELLNRAFQVVVVLFEYTGYFSWRRQKF